MAVLYSRGLYVECVGLLGVAAMIIGVILTDTEHRRAEEDHCDPYCLFYMLCDRQKKDF